MSEIMRPILEIAVIIPGMLLAYLPVKACLRQAPFKLGLWMFPLLLGISLSGGIVCYYFQIMTTLLQNAPQDDPDYFVFDSCIAVSHAALS